MLNKDLEPKFMNPKGSIGLSPKGSIEMVRNFLILYFYKGKFKNNNYSDLYFN